MILPPLVFPGPFNGAMTLSILDILQNDTQYNHTEHNNKTKLTPNKKNISSNYQQHCDECRSGNSLVFIGMLNVVMLSVVAPFLFAPSYVLLMP